MLVNGERTESFSESTGVRQGCILSPILFCIAIVFFMKTTNEAKTRIKWKDNRSFGDLDYADDICLINNSVAEMQDKTEAVSIQASKLGLITNTK